jgi:hypothetical protein
MIKVPRLHSTDSEKTQEPDLVGNPNGNGTKIFKMDKRANAGSDSQKG